ncbi:hypothetical protein [Massilia putida]|uniref:hypothetical protein n=1 Tax=Massilia putida TaxID=1141883 RepID=UPI0012EC2AC5|nr:hypothetical protein [Massilia putida]
MIDAILDPSAIPNMQRLERFVTLAEEHADIVKIYLPSIFFRMDSLTKTERETLGRFFKLPGQANIDFSFFQRNIDLGGLLDVTEAPEFKSRFDKHSEFLDDLRNEVDDDIVYQVLAEEWVFMNEYSYIAARVKRTFDKFLRAGAPYLIIGKKKNGTKPALSCKCSKQISYRCSSHCVFHFPRILQISCGRRLLHRYDCDFRRCWRWAGCGKRTFLNYGSVMFLQSLKTC